MEISPSQSLSADDTGSLSPGLDWAKSVIRIPDGVVIDISLQPVSREGHYADLFSGYHRARGLKVALKQPRQWTPQHTRRFYRESYTWNRLQHPNILPFLGVIFINEQIHLVSPFMENGTIDQYLKQFPNADRVDLLRQTAGAVAHMHDLLIVHGDIKASNILMGAHGGVLLCDFGLTEITELRGIPSAYSSGSCGNARWAAPELLEGKQRSAETDIWAFGMTIYEVIHGRVPFHTRGDLSVCLAIIQGILPDPEPFLAPEGLSYPRIWMVSTACWQRDPSMRLPMNEIAFTLRGSAIPDIYTEATSMQGHTGCVWSVAFSPDGLRLASASGDATVGVWDVGSGAELMKLRGHGEEVRAVAFSPNGKRLASGSGDWTVCVWDVASGTKVLTLKGHTGWVGTVAFSPYGSQLASGSEDSTVRLWDAASGAQLMTLRGHAGWVNAIAFSPHGSRIASASEDATVRLWDAVSGANVATLKGHTQWVRSLAFSSYGSRLASGSEDSTVRLWDAVSGEKIATLRGHEGDIRTVAFSTYGSRLASGSDDNNVRLWDVGSGAEVATLRGHTDWIRTVSFSPDGTRLASGSYDSTVRVWDATSGAEVGILRGHANTVCSVAFSPDGSRLASGSDDSTVQIWKRG